MRNNNKQSYKRKLKIRRHNGITYIVGKVTTLPTEEVTNIIVRTKHLNKGVPHLREYYGSAMLDMGDEYHHVYITSDEHIPDIGDYTINSHGELHKIDLITDNILTGPKTTGVDTSKKGYDKYVTLKDCRKIIATSNIMLTINDKCDLPQPNESFYKDYCYNATNRMISDPDNYNTVLVEVEKVAQYGKMVVAKSPLTNPNDDQSIYTHIPKVNRDNVVNVIIPNEKYNMYNTLDLTGNQDGSLDNFLLNSNDFSQEDRELIMNAISKYTSLNKL